MADLSGRHAIVTGGGRGIGAAIVKLLRAEGARVTIMGRTRIDDAAWIECDIASADSISGAFTEAERREGAAGILVNNAGQAEGAAIAKTDLELWNRMLAVNLTGTFLATRAALPGMIAGRFGRIVNIASVAGLEGASHAAAYCASKHGVVGLTRALAKELAKEPITVNAVCPGYTDTAMARGAIANLMRRGDSEKQARARLGATNPQGRLLHPEEVAAVVLPLCLPANTVTGQALPVKESA